MDRRREEIIYPKERRGKALRHESALWEKHTLILS